MKIFWIFAFCFGLVYAVPPPVPSAGVIERQLQEEYQPQPLEEEKEIPAVEVDIPEEKLEIPEGECIEVDHIEVYGTESISHAEVESWMEEFAGRKLCMREIYEACAKINAGYAKQGYFLARAYPPPQTIHDGVLVLEVLEGRLGKITVTGEKFYSERFIESYFSRVKGRALKYDTFMRALLLLNENSDLQAGAIFSKGEAVGTADLVINVHDKRPLHLYLNGNNYGRDITTNFRVGGRFQAGSIFTYGDSVSLVEVVGFPVNALYFTNLVYRVPVSRNGDFLELAYLYSTFKVEELLRLDLKGNSNIGTFKATHALTRSRQMSVDLFGYFDVKQFENYTLGTITSFDKLRVVTVGSLIDRFASKSGRDYLNVRCSVGIPNFLGSMAAVSSECSRPGAGGLFVKFNADYDHLQSLAQDWTLSLHGSAQGSFYKLAVPEQIYIGGVDTVRGFPLAVALGDSGYYGNIELRFPPLLLANHRFFMSKNKWREVLQLTAFVDSGGTFYYGGGDAFLWGSGVGLRFRGPKSLSLSLDVGFPLNRKDLSDGTMVYIQVTGQPF